MGLYAVLDINVPADDIKITWQPTIGRILVTLGRAGSVQLDPDTAMFLGTQLQLYATDADAEGGTDE